MIIKNNFSWHYLAPLLPCYSSGNSMIISIGQENYCLSDCYALFARLLFMMQQFFELCVCGIHHACWPIIHCFCCIFDELKFIRVDWYYLKVCSLETSSISTSAYISNTSRLSGIVGYSFNEDHSFSY